MSTVKFGTEGDLGILAFSNPPLNLMTWDMLDHFEAAVREISGPPIRALLIRADGPHAAQRPVVAPGPVVVAGDAPGVLGDGHEAGVGGQPPRNGEGFQDAAAGGDQES